MAKAVLNCGAGYCSVAHPISRKAKYHKGEYKVSLIVSRDEITGMDIDKTLKDTILAKMKTILTPSGDEAEGIEMYSKFPIPCYVNGFRVYPDEVLKNPNFGDEIRVALHQYENEYGNQLSADAIDLPETVCTEENPFM